MTKTSAYKIECELLRKAESILRESTQQHLFDKFRTRMLKTDESHQKEIMQELTSVQLKVIMKWI